MGEPPRERFAFLPESLLRHPDVRQDHVGVLAILALHANRQGLCCVRQGVIADYLGRSRAWVNERLRELAERGLVEQSYRFDGRGFQRASLYRLTHSHWQVPVDANVAEDLSGGSQENDISHQAVGSADTLCSPADSGCQPRQTPEHLPSEQDSKPALSAREDGFHHDRGQEGPDIASTWQPTAADIQWARHRHPNADLTFHTERFILRCQARGYRYADPSAAWRLWLAEDDVPAQATGRAQECRPHRGRSSSERAHLDPAHLDPARANRSQIDPPGPEARRPGSMGSGHTILGDKADTRSTEPKEVIDADCEPCRGRGIAAHPAHAKAGPGGTRSSNDHRGPDARATVPAGSGVRAWSSIVPSTPAQRPHPSLGAPKHSDGHRAAVAARNDAIAHSILGRLGRGDRSPGERAPG